MTEKTHELSIEEVLAAEVKAIHGDPLGQQPENQQQQKQRVYLNEDHRAVRGATANEVSSRYKFYRALNRLDQVALCCSGGGQRSAVFCLGVIQALAACNIDDFTVKKSAEQQSRDEEEHKNKEKSRTTPEKSLLGYFHYLSTVSGGGYIGSWLSAWRARSDFETVVHGLTDRPRGADIEPAAVSWLRAYSNYLTPRVGVTSADGWAAVAIVLRNMILNWLIIIPVVCFALLALKLTAMVSVLVAHHATDWWIAIAPCLGVGCLIVAQVFSNRHRPTLQRVGEDGATELRFILCDLSWATASAIFIVIFFTSRSFFDNLKIDIPAIVAFFHLSGLATLFNLDLKFQFLTITAAAGLVVYALGWLVALRYSKGWRDFLFWAASGLVYGALVGLGAYLFYLLTPYPVAHDKLLVLLLAMTLGVPWVLMSQLMAEIVFVGLASYEDEGDADREWLGRAAGWIVAAAVAWAIIAFLVFDGGYFVQVAYGPLHKYVVASGGVIGVLSGLVTALFGSSASTAAKPGKDDEGSFKSMLYNAALAVAGPVFVAVLIVVLSVGLDALLLGGSLVNKIQSDQIKCDPLQFDAVQCAHINAQMWWTLVIWLAIGLVIVAAVGAVASFWVNINRFSLHALYRNRLIRAYLGASNTKRKPDTFSGFDFKDNIRVHELWPDKPDKPNDRNKNKRCLFHVINIALNVVSTKRLAWQERKAESFTVSALHCGSSYLGFRPSGEYGDTPTAKRKGQGTKHNGRGGEHNGRGAEPKGQGELGTSVRGLISRLSTKVVGEKHKGQGAGEKQPSGIALGTAVAISGAAVSPNMGYHSSPSIALLLTLFNVRLGWWLGNPGAAGENTYKANGPRLAAKSLFSEALGLTTDDSPYVYLSDGGHFENLGLYEMVRRRCRLIVLIDAGCDPDFAFEDLGNAVRKIYIDLGIHIIFDDLVSLKNRPTSKLASRTMRDAAARAELVSAMEKQREEEEREKAERAAAQQAEPGQAAMPVAQHGRPAKAGGSKKASITFPAEPSYFAIGKIDYVNADHAPDNAKQTPGADPGKPNNGYIIYIKPAYHGTETSAGVRSYATANPEFPHESTVDQWFTESQFESYRSLGSDIGGKILKIEKVKEILREFLPPPPPAPGA